MATSWLEDLSPYHASMLGRVKDDQVHERFWTFVLPHQSPMSTIKKRTVHVS